MRVNDERDVGALSLIIRTVDTMLKRIKSAVFGGKVRKLASKIKAFADVGAVGMPEEMKEEDLSSDDEEESDEEEEKKVEEKRGSTEKKRRRSVWAAGDERTLTGKPFLNVATVDIGTLAGSKRKSRNDAEDEVEEQTRKENRAQRMIINDEVSARVSDSRRKLADQLACKKQAGLVDKRWETERQTAKLVDYSEGGEYENGVFADAFYGFAKSAAESEGKENDVKDAKKQGILSETSIEEKRQMREFLFSKVRHNHVDVVSTCIKGGTHNLLAVDDKGNTLLHIAAQNNLKKMASLLIKDGGFGSLDQLNRVNLKGKTALDYCELYKFEKMHDWLALQGAEKGGK